MSLIILQWMNLVEIKMWNAELPIKNVYSCLCKKYFKIEKNYSWRTLRNLYVKPQNIHTRMYAINLDLLC